MADQEQPAEDGKSGRMKLIIIIVVGVLVLVGGSIGATLMLVGGDTETAAADAESELSKKTPYYVELLDPKFAVNLAADSRAKFLKVSLSVLTYDPDVDTALRDHLPQLRSNLMILLSSKTSQELGGRSGREDLQKQLLERVQQTLGQVGVAGRIDDLYFTNFVMQ